MTWIQQACSASFAAFLRNVECAGDRGELKMSLSAYRGELLKRGYHVSGWAKHHGFQTSTVFEAMKGTRHGKLSRKIITKLNKEVGA